MVVCTKAGISRRSGERVVDTSRRSAAQPARRVAGAAGHDHVDLWLVHTWSDEAPLEETLSALEWAVTSGRARYVGVSNYSGWQSARAATCMSAGRVPLVANEVEYSLLNRVAEDEVRRRGERARARAAAVVTARAGGADRQVPPRRAGRLPGGVPRASRRFTARYLDDELAQVVDAVAIAAEGLEVLAAEVALAWVRDRPGVVAPIVGARTTAQLRTALASEELELPDELVPRWTRSRTERGARTRVRAGARLGGVDALGVQAWSSPSSAS